MPVTINPDKVWFDEDRKAEQICNEISLIRQNGRSVLLLSHFEATLSALAALLEAKGLTHERFSLLSPAELCSAPPGKIWLASARAFQVVSEVAQVVTATTLEIIVAEHHPMHSRDEELVQAAGKLPCKPSLTFHFSLDDPLMQFFGNERIKGLMEMLGMDKSECISHQLINTAIRSAQEKIERKVGKDVPTPSATDWFKYNVRGKKY